MTADPETSAAPDAIEFPPRRLDIAFVIPVFNDADSLPGLYREIVKAIEPITGHYEIIFIDDRSADASYEVAWHIANQDPRVRAVRLLRNYGHHSALMAGFHLADAEVVVTLDGDGENDPADISTLLDKMAEGYEIVFSVRQGRGDDPIMRQWPSRLVNWTLARLMGVNLTDISCNLKAWRRKAVLEARRYGSLPRLNPILSRFRVAEVPVSWRPRKHGRSQHSQWQLIRHGFFLISSSIGARAYTGALAIAAAGLLHWLLLAAGLFSFLRPAAENIAPILILVLDGALFALVGLLFWHQQKSFDAEACKPNFVIDEMYQREKEER